MTARFIVGDALEALSTLDENSVDLILSSPPFLALRSYLPADHPDKAKEGGSQATPGEYVDWLVDVVEACERVLAPHGSLCFELGDTYAGSGGAGGDYTDTGLRAGQQKFVGSALQHRRSAQRNRAGGGKLSRYADARGNPDGMRDPTFSGANTRTGGGESWPLEKSLSLIPELFRFTLVYGFNPLTGRETEQWRGRNIVRWVRPNPPVGELGDKFRPATTDLMVFAKAKDRYFDLDAVRALNSRVHETGGGQKYEQARLEADLSSGRNIGQSIVQNPNGAPPLDWWEIATAPYKGAHYATWPPALCVRPIKAMCPERVCCECGKPSRRIVGEAEYHQSPNAHASGRAPDDVTARKWDSGIPKGKNQSADLRDGGVMRVAPTLGWTDCGHDDWRRGLVLDPFAGTGVTLAVATGLGRDAIGIDLDERNVDLARDRVGMFLEVVPA